MKRFEIKCDTCPSMSHKMNTENEVVAQKILTDHFGWKVYQVTKGLPMGQLYEWKRACPECVKRYAINISKARRRIV